MQKKDVRLLETTPGAPATAHAGHLVEFLKSSNIHVYVCMYILTYTYIKISIYTKIEIHVSIYI